VNRCHPLYRGPELTKEHLPAIDAAAVRRACFPGKESVVAVANVRAQAVVGKKSDLVGPERG